MSKLLILGDPHLGGSQSLGRPGIGSALNSRLSDQFNLLEWTLEQAINHSVSTIIITGDVFDDPKPSSTIITLLISWLRKCADNDIDVHIIMGNHDQLRSGQIAISALDIISAAELDRIYVHKNMSTIHLDDFAFTILPFRDRKYFNTNSNTEALSILNQKIPYEARSINPNIHKLLIGHLAIEGSIYVGNEIDDLTNELFCPLSMFEEYNYVFMGHIHKPQVLSKFPYISHIGSMDISDFSEANHTKVVAIFDPKKGNPVKYLEIPTRPLKQISITVPAQINNTTSYVLSELEKVDTNKSTIKLNIMFENPDVINIDRSMVEKFLYDAGTFYINRINEERKLAEIKKPDSADIDNTVNETTAIKMYADTNIEQSIKSGFIKTALSIVEETSLNQ